MWEMACSEDISASTYGMEHYGTEELDAMVILDSREYNEPFNKIDSKRKVGWKGAFQESVFVDETFSNEP